MGSNDDTSLRIARLLVFVPSVEITNRTRRFGNWICFYSQAKGRRDI